MKIVENYVKRKKNLKTHIKYRKRIFAFFNKTDTRYVQRFIKHFVQELQRHKRQGNMNFFYVIPSVFFFKCVG